MQFYVWGGDKRSDHLAELLKEDGFCVQRTEPDTALERGAVILPYPCVKNGLLNSTDCKLQDILPYLQKAEIIFAGDAPADLIDFARSNKVKLIDYAAKEDFLLKNAAITAEAALSLVLGTGEETLADKNIVVCGYGRIGKRLSKLLMAFGCRAFIAARSKEARMAAVSEGLKAFPINELGSILEAADIVFNTVPSIIIDKPLIKNAKKSLRYIELASHPGGIDQKAAQELGIKIISEEELYQIINTSL